MSHTESYSTFVPGNNDIETPVQAGASTNWNTGGITITTSGGNSSFKDQSSTSVNAGELSPFDASDWRSTARSPGGGATNDLTAETIVQVGGVSASISSFMKAGVMVKNGDSFALAGQPDAPQEQAKSEQADPDMASMSIEQERAVNEAIAPLSQETFDSCIANGAAIASGEMKIEDMVAKISNQSGLDPAQAAQSAAVAQAVYQAEADNFVVKAGLHADDLPEFYQWCRSSGNKSALKQAVEGQLYMRSLAGYRSLVAGYMAVTPPSTEALTAGGFKTRVLGGVSEVQLQGRWMPIESAARAGLI